jgi:hypothetical protein
MMQNTFVKKLEMEEDHSNGDKDSVAFLPLI